MNISYKNKFFYFLLITAFSVTSFANADNYISETELFEIEDRVNSMGTYELKNRMVELEAEKEELLQAQASTQNPTVNKNIVERLALVTAESTAIQKALATLLGAAAVSALTSDDYNDEIPPVSYTHLRAHET